MPRANPGARRMSWSSQEIAERAVQLCRADGCLVVVTEQSEANVRWAGNALTTDGTAHSRRITVVATSGHGQGTSAGVVSAAGDVAGLLADLVATAERSARSAEPAEDAQPLVATSGGGTDWLAPIAETSVAAFSDFAPALGAAFAEAAASGRALYGYAEDRVRASFLASSTGLRLRTDQASSYIELTGRSVDGRRSAWAGVAGDLSEAAVLDLYRQVDRRLGWAGRRLELPPGRYPVLLPPVAVADLVNYAYWAADARRTADGQTVFSTSDGGTRLGERLSSAPLTLRGDPAEPGLECAPFVLAAAADSEATVSHFDSGLPLHRTKWIDDGVLSALVQTRHSAALTGLPLTPHIDNLVLEGAGSGGSLDDLVAGLDRGLLLTTVWYLREVDPATLLLTGLTRDGVFLVERGEVVGAVNNFRFNESPVDLLGRVQRVGTAVPTRARETGDAFAHCAMPPLQVADFTMSSVSPAV
jgi:predicted Zn-dependent protease